MNRNIWIVLAVVILVGLGVFLYNQSNQNPTAPAPQPATQTKTPTSTQSTAPVSQNMVTYTDSGFSPASLTVKVGDTVTFKNGSSKLMWVASNPHPTHTGLPGFDALSGMAKSQNYTYTFTKAGSFGYHNHLSTSDGGTITVQ